MDVGWKQSVRCSRSFDEPVFSRIPRRMEGPLLPEQGALRCTPLNYYAFSRDSLSCPCTIIPFNPVYKLIFSFPDQFITRIYIYIYIQQPIVIVIVNIFELRFTLPTGWRYSIYNTRNNSRIYYNSLRWRTIRRTVLSYLLLEEEKGKKERKKKRRRRKKRTSVEPRGE